MPGPDESRLIQAITGIKPGHAGGGADEWDACADILDQVADRLTKASMPIPIGEAGAHTAQAMDHAFAKSAGAMGERALKLRQGGQALRNAQEVMKKAREAHEALGPEGSGPGDFRTTAEPHSDAWVQQKKDHDAEAAAFEAEKERRERISRHWANQMDTTFHDSANTMREIHGEPPIPPPEHYSGNHGGVSSPTTGGGGAPAAPSVAVAAVAAATSATPVTVVAAMVAATTAAVAAGPSRTPVVGAVAADPRAPPSPTTRTRPAAARPPSAAPQGASAPEPVSAWPGPRAVLRRAACSAPASPRAASAAASARS